MTYDHVTVEYATKRSMNYSYLQKIDVSLKHHVDEENRHSRIQSLYKFQREANFHCHV